MRKRAKQKENNDAPPSFLGQYREISHIFGASHDLAAGFAILLISPAAFAQYRASIQGTVADAQGGVIPNAKLTLTNTATNETQTRTTNGEGVYNFNALPPNIFKLTVEATGFQTKELDNVQIQPEQANAINVQLNVAAQAQTVTVDASNSPLMDTETATVGGTISENEIQHMPSFGRDVFQLTNLAPGTTGDQSQAGRRGNLQPAGNPGSGWTGRKRRDLRHGKWTANAGLRRSV